MHACLSSAGDRRNRLRYGLRHCVVVINELMHTHACGYYCYHVVLATEDNSSVGRCFRTNGVAVCITLAHARCNVVIDNSTVHCAGEARTAH
jgi:hypothetical protein